MDRIELDNNKYTVIRTDTGLIYAERHGEYWRDLTGDNLIFFMIEEILKLRSIIDENKKNLLVIKSK